MVQITKAQIFDPNRNYSLGDPELDLIGIREKLAQWRHRNYGPSYVKFGKKVIYRGVDLNARAEDFQHGPRLPVHLD